MSTLWMTGYDADNVYRDETSVVSPRILTDCIERQMRSFKVSWSQIFIVDGNGHITSPASIISSRERILDIAVVDEKLASLTESGEITFTTDIKNDSSINILPKDWTDPIHSINSTDNKLIIHHNENVSAVDIPCGIDITRQQIQCPYPLSLEVKVKQVSCGKEHVLILTKTGQVYTYGGGSRGQLGHGNVENQFKARIMQGLVGVAIETLSAGGWHSTAISSSGDLYVWGWNESGQLGLPGKIRREKLETENQVLLTGTSQKVQGQESESKTKDIIQEDMALKTTDSYLPDQGILRSQERTVPIFSTDLVPHESQILQQDVGVVQVLSEPRGLDLGEDILVKKVACGTRHTVILTKGDLPFTCGWNGYGQLGLGDMKSRDYLESVNFFLKRNQFVVDIHAGGWTSLFITKKFKDKI